MGGTIYAASPPFPYFIKTYHVTCPGITAIPPPNPVNWTGLAPDRGAGGLASRMRRFPSRHAVLKAPLEGRLAVPTLALFSPGGRWRMRWAPQTPQIGKISTAKRSIDIRTPGKLRPARLGGGYAGESSADAERPAQEEAATEIDEISVTGQRDYLYRADQSDALGTSIPLAELPATVNVITEDFLEDTRAYDIEDV